MDKQLKNRNCRISWGGAGMSENSPSISNNQFDDFRYVIDKAMADTSVMIPYDEIYGCTMSDSVSDNLAQCLLVFDNGSELMDQFKDEIDTTLGAIYKEFNINPTWYEYREDSTNNFSKYYTASTLSLSDLEKEN